MKRLYVILLFALLLVTGSCTNRPETPISPLSSQSVLESPPSTPESPAVPPLRFDEPLMEGATEVTGTGPAGVPILIVDVSLNTEIGRGEVGPEGRFRVEVNPSLVYPNLIGVMLDESRSSPYTKEEIPCVERCRDQPLVGLLFDRLPVQKP
jgi:hypothetical protein